MADSINWREWGEEAFREAREQNKPLLLAIAAMWCHWCHVMDSTSYSDEQVIQAVNEKLIPVRVDTDKRPDLNARFNMGGWPSTVFMTPEGDILTGGTYIPPVRMLNLVRKVAQVFATEREELAARAAEMRGGEHKTLEPAKAEPIAKNAVDYVLGAARMSYDQVFAGFGRDQKFPHVPTLRLLLNRYRRTKNPDLLDMATATLRRMRQGGIWDEVAGGFFRYATKPDWTEPHYEKMLEDNIGLMGAYIDAYRVTGVDFYLVTVRLLAGYLESTLYDREKHVFYGSQDADEEYYKLDAEKRRLRRAPSVDRTIFVNWNALAAAIYLEVYSVTGDRHFLGVGLEALDFILENCRSEKGYFYHYYTGSAQRELGLLSDQASMLLALVQAFECSGRRKYLTFAEETAARMREHFEDIVGGFFDITEEHRKAEMLPERQKMLDENSLAARGLIRLGRLKYDDDLIASAEKALRVTQGDIASYGVLAAPFALAAVEFLEEPVKVTIAGDLQDPRTKELLASALKARRPEDLVEVRDPMPTEDGLKTYICHGQTCKTASDDPERLSEEVYMAYAG